VIVTAYAADMGKIAGDEQAMRWEEMGLSERQVEALLYAKKQGQISRRDYAQLTGVATKTAYRDLAQLVARGILETRGTGRYTHYVFKEEPK
jgi:predicted HTH transcriptional regulator